MKSRRDILKALGATMAASAAGFSVAARAATLRAFADGTDADAPWCLLSPLDLGASVGKGWRLSQLDGVKNGASILTLKHSAHGSARIHICARKGQSHGLTHTQLLDLVLMDGANGNRRTREDLARVVTGIAKRIEKNEVCAVDDSMLDAMNSMLTHDERMALYGPENLL